MLPYTIYVHLLDCVPPSRVRSKEACDEKWQFLTSTLSSHAIDRVSYVDQNKRPCDDGTRMEILDEIRKWSCDVSDDSQRLLWLTGIPGAGKSAITASFARELNDAGCLWAQFFINRNDARTLKPATIFPSIALQLANHCHSIAEQLHDVLHAKRSLVDDISDEQAQKLFVEAMAVASSLSPSQPVVVVIDALDESDTTRLCSTAKIFGRLAAHLPHNAKLFISSRPENDILNAFQSECVKRVDLSTSAPSSIRDVTLFLSNGMRRIVEDCDLDDVAWPGDETLQLLSEQASGLFIWAATAVTFIRDQIYDQGKECLDDVMHQLSAEGMEDINKLYHGILETTYIRQRKNLWAMETFRRVTGAVLTLQKPLPLSALEKLLDLKKPGATRGVDLVHFFRRLRTILVVGSEATIDENTVPRVHKSFFEFITSEHADSCFRVSKGLSSTELALACFQTMKSGLRFNICQLETSYLRNENFPNLAARVEQNIPKHLSYSCVFWSSHLNVTESGVCILAEVGDFLFSRFLYWLEALSMLKEVQAASQNLSSLLEWVKVSMNFMGTSNYCTNTSLSTRTWTSRYQHLLGMLASL
jgi:NACHT domain.